MSLALPALKDKPIAIIPARGGSKRIPRKNIADMNGQPLMSYPIRACLDSGIFQRVIVSTEDDEIGAIACAWGAEVDRRPMALADDRVPATLVIKDILERLQKSGEMPDHFCLVYAIAVFLEPRDLRDSAAELQANEGVLGVSEYAIHPYKTLVESDGCLQALWPDLNAQQSQNFPAAFASNGTFCWMRSEHFLQCQSFYPTRLHGHVLPIERAVDIDTPADLERARRMMAFNSHSGG